MRSFLAAAIVAVLVLATAASGARELANPDIPILLQADEISHDRAHGIVTARGHVEVSQGERILLADRLVYEERTDTVRAEGHVALLEPSGEVLFADSMELSDSLKNGVVRRIRVLMSDHSRLAANGARRTGGVRTEMSKAVYSPCDLCKEDPTRAPLWQIKAIKVVHDTRRKTIEYFDAWFEAFGIPIFYTPFFSHPDPTVKRKSGLLAPVFRNSSELGFTIKTPYYFNIAPDRDATFAPIFTTNEGVVLTGEYRQRTHTGRFEFSGSITRPDARDAKGNRTSGTDTRGHIFGQGRFNLGRSGEWGFDLARSTDDTFLSRYGFRPLGMAPSQFGYTSVDTLTTRLFVEGQGKRSFASATGLAFQGLDPEDDPGETPLILPLVEYAVASDPSPLGAYLSANASALVLGRKEGADSRRLSLGVAWHLPYVGRGGDIYDIKFSLRGDLYHVSGVPNPDEPTASTQKGLTGRLLPRASLTWRYPLIQRSGAVSQVIEPVVMAIIQPQGGNPGKIPNEDSKDFEFDDTNLFSLNRFTGLDRVEGGSRLNYGLRWGAFGAHGGRTTILIGQVLRSKDDNTFNSGSGLDRNLSDFVGRVEMAPSDLFTLRYRFRLDRSNLTFRRNELNLNVGPKWLRGALTFTELEGETSASGTETFGNREELAASVRAKISNYWTFTANMRRDLGGNGSLVNAGAGVIYEDECTFFTLSFNRRLTRDRDIRPETNVLFSIKFKHLG